MSDQSRPMAAEPIANLAQEYISTPLHSIFNFSLRRFSLLPYRFLQSKEAKDRRLPVPSNLSKGSTFAQLSTEIVYENPCRATPGHLCNLEATFDLRSFGKSYHPRQSDLCRDSLSLVNNSAQGAFGLSSAGGGQEQASRISMFHCLNQPK